jgi:dipeptidyl aminopeptidase/acylaminoacyl peptidase
VLLLSYAAPVVSQERPTLAQIMSAPFATELVAAPAGGWIAWVQNILGERNIWLAGPPDYTGRQLTRFVGDDGRYLVQLAFTPDASHIVFVRGGAHTGTRVPEPPNPTLDPAGGKEEVWIVSVSGGEPIRIDDGVWPAVSPSGAVVAYIKRDEIWGAPLTVTSRGVSVGTPRQLVRDQGRAAPQGNAASLLWSPVADRLAFISLRDQHSFIGVYDADANTLLYLDPSFDRDGQPVWSPDGSRVAFIRLPASAGRAEGEPRRPALPWSIRVADAATGSGRQVWRADPGMGSAFWGFMNSEHQLFWGADDRIAFPWERTGWVHLYSVPAAGGRATELTPGEFEVEHVALMPDGRELVFSSNQGDIDRRHLWRVPIAAAPPTPSTTGAGIEWWPVPTSDGSVLAFLASAGRIPPRAEFVRITPSQAETRGRPLERQLLVPDIAPPQFPAAALVEPQQVTFPSVDGVPIHGQLFLPPNYQPASRYPAVLYFHGGPNAQMVLGYHYHRFDYYQKMYALNQYLAQEEYIVLSVNYRRGTGYGIEFREAPNPPDTDPRRHRDVIDVIGAGEYLRTRPDVDPSRIGLWGGSAGGGRTVAGLAFAPELFAAGFDLHGTTALVRGRTAAWQAPVLIVHGDDDRNVQFSQSVALAAELIDRGIVVESLVLPNETHSFMLHSSWLRAFEAAADFFDRRLKQARTPAEARR